MANILVTYPPDEPQRRTMLNVLDRCGRVVFLSDLYGSDRGKEIGAAEVLISWNPTRELQPSEFKILSHLRLLQLLSAGVDHVQFTQIPLTVTIAGNAGAYAEQMAEHVLAMALAVLKNLLDRHNKLADGTFDQRNENRLLRGSTCAILGFGGIGKATARLMRCLGVRIFAINTSGETNEEVDFIGTLDDIEHVLQVADIVVISLPLTNSTRGLIGNHELGWMKDDATIINVARGDIIDEGALFKKLKEHPTFNAAIDAWWTEPLGAGKFEATYPFLKLPNVLASPHNSGLVPGSFVIAARYAAENVRRFLNQEPLSGIVKRSDYI